MTSLWLSTNRWLTWFHRWAGVVLCLLFAVWFASGAVLHFVAFPSLSRHDQHVESEAINLSRILIRPSDALAQVRRATDLRLVSVAGRPVFLVQSPSRLWVSVGADTGQLLAPFSAATATAVAESFARSPALYVSGPINYDQWIVHQHFDPYRPYYRVRLNDSAMTDLYVSARTGEVLQRTRFVERVWNWCGAVIHWIYFTPLRSSYRAWNQVVWWVSLIAVLSSAVGTWLGFLRFASNRAAGRKGISPFRRWMRWHHIIGLFASIIVVAWIFSGWLSMDHGRLFSFGEATQDEVAHMSGIPVSSITRAATLDSLQGFGATSEITFNAVASRPFLTAYASGSNSARILFLDSAVNSLLTALPDSLLYAGVDRVWPRRVHAVLGRDANDGLYRSAESTTGDAAVFRIATNSALRVYVDRYSGRFQAVMDSSRRSYAWIYYALHTFKFPGLIEHPQVRTVIVLTLLSLGFLLSITGVVLSVTRVRREFA